MKLKLDTEGMNEDFFASTRLLGITAPLKCYQFCLLLNQQLGYRFRLNAEHEIPMRRKERTYYFSVYQSNIRCTYIFFQLTNLISFSAKRAPKLRIQASSQSFSGHL